MDLIWLSYVSHRTAIKPFISKMKGNGKSTLQINIRDIITALIGGFITIFALVILTKMTSTPWLMAPFGASCVLAFGVWNTPLSQPRNIIGGHFVSTFVGLTTFHIFGDAAWAIGLSVGLAIAIMMLTKTTHPPAGADPLVVMLDQSSWSYLITPVLIGSVMIVLFALIINNLSSKREYPVFWI